tara:strand:+ start:201 stop:671 length:471 start_codon:yes stop_codon:yes gene_type:complete
MEIINSIISIVAVIISLIALIRGRKNSQKLIELEEIHAQLSLKQLEEYEKKEADSLKASLNVSLHADGSSGKYVIENRGPAVAKNIYFSLNEEGGHNPLVSSDFEKKIPYPLLNPGEAYHFKARFPLAVTQMIYSVDLRWHTEDGILHKKTFTVSR